MAKLDGQVDPQSLTLVGILPQLRLTRLRVSFIYGSEFGTYNLVEWHLALVAVGSTLPLLLIIP